MLALIYQIEPVRQAMIAQDSAYRIQLGAAVSQAPFAGVPRRFLRAALFRRAGIDTTETGHLLYFKKRLFSRIKWAKRSPVRGSRSSCCSVKYDDEEKTRLNADAHRRPAIQGGSKNAQCL